MKKNIDEKRRHASTPLVVNVARDQSFEGKLEINILKYQETRMNMIGDNFFD